MKLPQRQKQHISETASYKLFSSKIPDNWIVRDVTERDYGIDCYLELVNDNNELSGEIALIQLKSKQNIPWTKDDTYTLNGIEISTTNYWYKFPIPVFIFLTDIQAQELFFISVDYVIKRNFDDYVKQDVFSYKIKRSYIFEGESGIFAFKFHFYYCSYRSRFERELVYFLSNLVNYHNFISEHWNRDLFFELENIEIVFLESMFKNYSFLCTYCNVDWKPFSFREIKEKTIEKWGVEYANGLYELEAAEIVQRLDQINKPLIKSIKQFLHGEMSYWKFTNPSVYELVETIDDNGHYLVN